jgi:cobalt/nickel transport system permease protein
MQGRLFAEIFALVFIRSFERSERVHKAMIARGFSGTYGTAAEVPGLRMSEYLFVGISAALVLAVAYISPRFGA